MTKVIAISVQIFRGHISLALSGESLVMESGTMGGENSFALKDGDRVAYRSDDLMVVLRHAEKATGKVNVHDIRSLDLLPFALDKDTQRDVVDEVQGLTVSKFYEMPLAGMTVSTIEFTTHPAGEILLVNNKAGVVYTNTVVADGDVPKPTLGQSVIWNSPNHRVVMVPIEYTEDTTHRQYIHLDALRETNFVGITHDMDLFGELFSAVRRRVVYANKKSTNRRGAPLAVGLVRHDEVPTANLMLTYFNNRVYAIIPAVGEARFGRKANRAFTEGLAFGINVHADLRVIYQFVNPGIDLDGIPLDVTSEDFVQWKLLTQAFDAVCAEIGGVDKIKGLSEMSFNTAIDCWVRED